MTKSKKKQGAVELKEEQLDTASGGIDFCKTASNASLLPAVKPPSVSESSSLNFTRN